MKKFIDVILMLIVLGTLLMITFSFGNKIDQHKSSVSNSPKQVPDSLVRSGDLVFREGRGFISDAFRRLSLNDPRYSHAGIIHRENDKVYVFHIIGGEGKSPQTIRKDLLKDFCSTLQSNAYGIYRFNLDGKRIDSLAVNYFSKKINFDSSFNLASDDKMYCTELLYKILQKISGQKNYLPLTTFSGITYVSCDNIYLSSHSEKIYSSRYSY